MAKFSGQKHTQRGYEDEVYNSALYDFLYDREYAAWFCNAARSSSRYSRRALKDWFLAIHTGESVTSATKSWTWEQRRKLGQTYLQNLGKDFVRWVDEYRPQHWESDYKEQAQAIRRGFELDGYAWRDGDLFENEADVLSVEEESGILHNLYTQLNLGRKDEAFQFLKLSEDHFLAGRWSDCIGNARKFLELTLAETYRSAAPRLGASPTDATLERPVQVRQALENDGFLERRERETLDKVYGLLSHTGGHPYMAEKDQARLLRQLTLTLTQFVMLRLEGFISNGVRPASA